MTNFVPFSESVENTEGALITTKSALNCIECALVVYLKKDLQIILMK